MQRSDQHGFVYRMTACEFDFLNGGGQELQNETYIQSLFADRIGGSMFGKDTEDLQVREDQAGEARGAGRPSRGGADRLRRGRARRDGLSRRGADPAEGSGKAGEPRLCRQRHPGVQGRRRALYAEGLRRFGHRSRDRGAARHRQQARARHVPGGLHQSRRRDAHDRAGISRSWARIRAGTAARS